MPYALLYVRLIREALCTSHGRACDLVTVKDKLHTHAKISNSSSILRSFFTKASWQISAISVTHLVKQPFLYVENHFIYSKLFSEGFFTLCSY